MDNYILHLNSRTSSAGTNNNDLEYEYDFSHFAEGSYKIHFNFVSEILDLQLTKIPLVFSNLVNSNTYTTGTINNAIHSTYLGTLISKNLHSSTENYLKATPDDNFPVYTLKPNQNTIKIQIRDNTNALYTDDAGGNMSEYTLTFYFERIL
jgi:hypothetical protein